MGWIIIKYLQTRSSWKLNSMEAVIIHSSIIMIIWNCLIFHCIEWHWHREFEFLYVESGKVICGIGEKQIALSEGEGIFINSKILHRFYTSSVGIIPNFLCMPEFIAPENSLIYKKYILPVISSNILFQCFRSDVSWQTRIIQNMIK